MFKNKFKIGKNIRKIIGKKPKTSIEPGDTFKPKEKK